MKHTRIMQLPENVIVLKTKLYLYFFAETREYIKHIKRTQLIFCGEYTLIYEASQ